MCNHHHKVATGKHFKFACIGWMSAVEFVCADCGKSFWYPSCVEIARTASGRSREIMRNTGRESAAWLNEF